MSKYQSRVFLGDLQRPFQDEAAVSVVERFLSSMKPDAVHFVGDVLDFYQLSSHERDPAKRVGLWEQLQADKSWLRQLRDRLPNARFEWEDGNHEARLRRYLWQQAPELADFPTLRLEELLGFGELEITHKPYTQGTLLAQGNFLVVHGDLVRPQSAYTARAMLDQYGVSGISGHTHRMGSHYKHNLGGYFAWFENGCLCRMEGMEYITHPNWQQGFSVGYFKEDRFHIDQVPILSGRVLYGGKEW